MNICMAGIDHTGANIAQREQFAMISTQITDALRRLRAFPGVCGCVLLCTCNRTELYLSAAPQIKLRPEQLLCAVARVTDKKAQDAVTVRYGKDAAKWLFETASGLRSLIFGDDQIVTQVKRAIRLAWEAQVTDAVMETLFRHAVTAGKQVKTETRLTAIPLSAAHRGVSFAERKLGDLTGCRAVVIGNGEMGRLACELLVACGAQVTVTLRSYRHGQTIVPRGCSTQPYDERLAAIDGCDLVISATTSPHYTLSTQLLQQLDRLPKMLLDLAMPRDIEPAAASLLPVYNIDDLGQMTPQNLYDCTRAQDIITQQLRQFYEWANYREALPAMQQVKQILFARVWTGEGEEETIRAAVERTVDLLLGSMHESVTPAQLERARYRLNRKPAAIYKLRKRV